MAVTKYSSDDTKDTNDTVDTNEGEGEGEEVLLIEMRLTDGVFK